MSAGAIVSWSARSGDLELACITPRGSAVYYVLRRAGSAPLILTAAEFHDLMYAGRRARRPSLSPS